jgi:hypothetical protein
MKDKDFMPAYDINNSDGSATLNLFKAALLTKWRETFRKLPFFKEEPRENLLSCPFCGTSDFDENDTLYPNGQSWREGSEGLRDYGDYRQFDNKCMQIVCKCGAIMHGDSEEEVIALWNTRAPWPRKYR